MANIDAASFPDPEDATWDPTDETDETVAYYDIHENVIVYSIHNGQNWEVHIDRIDLKEATDMCQSR